MSKHFLTPDPKLALGSIHANFSVERVEAIPEAEGTAYLMRHSSGARLIWLATDDDNRSFAIGFKTPPQDDTGVFHIIEHSVLDGSDRFPVKEPFVHLLKSSMQTFLNALTYPDKTIYPVASTNMKDLENLMDVYLDAVFHPAIYSRPRIFEQEAWHYELAESNEQTSLIYNGVVFNEMKGALSDPDDVLFCAMCSSLFPNTAYRFVSGGDPRAIPQLTYEQFLDAHARHYNLANSYTFLYGDLDIEHMLSFIDERFAKVEPRSNEPANPLEIQAPIKAGYTHVNMATAPENASVSLGYVLGTSKDRETVFNADILLDALMGSNEAPLKRAILQSGLGEDVSCSIIDGTLQPVLYVHLKGAKEGIADEFRTLFEDSCAKLAGEGIDPALIDASLSRAEFTLRERDFGFYTNGIAYAVQALSGWLYDDDSAFDYLRYEDLLTQAKERLANGGFEELLLKLVNNSEHSATVELIPSETGTAEEEAQELASKFESLSEEEIQAIAAEADALREEQETPDSEEALATLPRLSLNDIGEGTPDPNSYMHDFIIPCYAHDISTNQVSYLYTYFDLVGLRFEELPYVSVLCRVLGKLGTKKRSASELDIAIEGGLGNLSIFTEVYPEHADPEKLAAFLVVGTSALSEKIEFAAELPQEIWSSSDLHDTDRIFDLLTQQRIQMEQNFLGAGHSAAMARVASYFSRAALCEQQLSGVNYYFFLKELLANFDSRKEELSNKLEELAGRIFSANNAQMSFTGSEEDFAAWSAKAGDLSLSDISSEKLLDIPEPQVLNEGIVVPGNVCYVCEGMDGRALGSSYSGSWLVASKILSLDYLWDEVRVKGGAYGCGFSSVPSGLLRMYSYRDPAVDPTLSRYEASASWLESWKPAQDDFEGYVISTVSGFDAPVKPRAKARTADTLRLCKRPEGWRLQMREEALRTGVEDVRKHADTLSHLQDNGGVCVFGAKDLIEASARNLRIVELMGGE